MLTIGNNKYLVEKEASARFGLSVHWFRRARLTGNTPIYHKLHGRVLYREDQIEDWFKNNLIACG